MLTALDILEKYISFFEKRGHKRIPNAPLVPENDPTTLFTSSGMQPLVPYLLGEPHSAGKRLVNVQNCFRAADIEEVGDNRHTTFFRMLGNWSLGDYFKKEQLIWFFEFLTNRDEGLGLDPNRLCITFFKGEDKIPKDQESEKIWQELFQKAGLSPQEHIFSYGFDKNWWSRSGFPEDMPSGEPGGPDSEVFYDFQIPHNPKFGKTCHPNCPCGRFLEIGNSVFMEYQSSFAKASGGQEKKIKKFVKLSQKNVDFGGGLERLLAAVEDKADIFQTSLFAPIIRTIEQQSNFTYRQKTKPMRIIADHLIAVYFMIAAGVVPSNKDQGYLLRRLIRRAVDSAEVLGRPDFCAIIQSISSQYQKADPVLREQFEKIELTVVEEVNNYYETLTRAKKSLSLSPSPSPSEEVGDELMGVVKISADDAFKMYSTHGLSPTQIRSLGYVFNEQEFVQKIREHQEISRRGAKQKFSGGLADQSEKTIAGHTATHLLHQALRLVLGKDVYQTGSNITPERLRFDFSYEGKPTAEQLKQIEDFVNEKIRENLPVVSEIMNKDEALKSGALGIFAEKYEDKVTVYSIGNFSREICGGPHVNFTGKLKKFKIKKEESAGSGKRRIYAVLESS